MGKSSPGGEQPQSRCLASRLGSVICNGGILRRGARFRKYVQGTGHAVRGCWNQLVRLILHRGQERLWRDRGGGGEREKRKSLQSPIRQTLPRAIEGNSTSWNMLQARIRSFFSTTRTKTRQIGRSFKPPSNVVSETGGIQLLNLLSLNSPFSANGWNLSP